jgi:hypothetical protein
MVNQGSLITDQKNQLTITQISDYVFQVLKEKVDINGKMKGVK